jgi:thiol-disulfide isomerase/thioredoxin
MAAVLAELQEEPARLRLVNVWATFCRPCREELPDLVRIRKEFAGLGVQVALVSADVGMPPRMLVKSLGELGVDFPTWQLTKTDAALFASMHEEWRGEIPATFLYDGEGRLLDFWVGKESYEGFLSRLQAQLKVAGEP